MNTFPRSHSKIARSRALFARRDECVYRYSGSLSRREFRSFCRPRWSDRRLANSNDVSPFKRDPDDTFATRVNFGARAGIAQAARNSRAIKKECGERRYYATGLKSLYPLVRINNPP